VVVSAPEQELERNTRPLVVFTADNRYLKYGLAAATMAESFSQDAMDIKVLCTDSISARTIVSSGNIELVSISEHADQLNHLPEFQRSFSHISRAMYARLLLPILFPRHDFCIYIDVDTMPVIDLKNLWELRHPDFLVQGVQRGYHPYLNALGFDENSIYVNSGVLIINLKRWRANNIALKIVNKIVESSSSLFHPDQDAINIICRGFIGTLPFQYNFNPLNPEINVPVELGARLNSDMSDAIFHFYGKSKPWMSDFDLRWSRLYRTFLSRVNFE
jgi:lipopolysaccharide biosynthesis glycosyltransferase